MAISFIRHVFISLLQTLCVTVFFIVNTVADKSGIKALLGFIFLLFKGEELLKDFEASLEPVVAKDVANLDRNW